MSEFEVGTRVRAVGSTDGPIFSFPEGSLGTVREVLDHSTIAYIISSALLGYFPDVDIEWDESSPSGSIFSSRAFTDVEIVENA